MADEPMRIDFQQFADDLQGVFDQVHEQNRPVLVQRDGELYRIEPADNEVDIFAGYAPVRVQEALRQSAGALQGVGRDELLRDLYVQREQDSRGRPA